MKFKKLSKWFILGGAIAIVLVFTALLISRKQQTPETSLPPIDYQQARDLSDKTVKDLTANDSKDLFGRLDLGFHNMVRGPEDVDRVFQKMYGLYGRPLEWKFKVATMGIREDGQWKRPSRTFYYTVKTTKYPVGKYFLKIEVVQAFSGGFIDVSGFGFFAFKDGKVPDYLQ